MNRILIAALATTALTGGAFAAESQAFIGQVGNGHDAANIQLNQDAGFQNGIGNDYGSPSTAVIYQEETIFNDASNGHTALQVQLAPGNYAYTYQATDYADDDALTWQTGPGNTAVTVQLSSANGGTEEQFTSQVIQNGAHNVAVNWQSDGGYNSGQAQMMLSPTDPTIFLGQGNIALAPYLVSIDPQHNGAPQNGLPSIGVPSTSPVQ